MAIAVLREVVDSIGQMEQAVMRDPGSPETRLSVEQTVRLLDQFVASGEMRALLALEPKRRPTLPLEFAEAIRRLFDSLQPTLSVAIQMEQLGEHADWIVPLENALTRLQSMFVELGVAVDRSWKLGPPIVTRTPGPDGEPKFIMTTKSFRSQRLLPYIDLAMRGAQPVEIESGQWYADLERFPGVWGDGETPEECLEVLADVLHEWIVVKVVLGDNDIPVLNDLDPRTLVRADLPR
jgi:predicted RNase H-like HicB family nuclease